MKIYVLETDDYFLLQLDGENVDSGHSVSMNTIEWLAKAAGIEIKREYIDDPDEFNEKMWELRDGQKAGD